MANLSSQAAYSRLESTKRWQTAKIKSHSLGVNSPNLYSLPLLVVLFLFFKRFLSPPEARWKRGSLLWLQTRNQLLWEKNAQCYFGTWDHSPFCTLPVSESHSIVVSMQHCNADDLGSIPSRAETLDSVSVNHSLTTTRCKIGTSPVWDDGMWGSNEDDCYLVIMRWQSHQGWASSQVGSWLGSQYSSCKVNSCVLPQAVYTLTMWARPGWRNRIVLALQVSDPHSIPGPGNKRWLGGGGIVACKWQKSAGSDEPTLTLKPVGRVTQSLKQGVPVAPQNGPGFNKNL